MRRKIPVLEKPGGKNTGKKDMRATSAKRGYDWNWRRARAHYIARYPWCTVCGAPGEHVDHIIPLKLGGARLDERNLQTLCASCHAVKTRRET